MTFDEILDRAIEMLQRRGRLTYRALKLQFNLDDDYLDALKAELTEGQRLAVDENGSVLVWTGEPAAPEADAQPRGAAENRFHAILPVLTGLLQREGRLTYRNLIQIFGLDDALLTDIRKELHFRRLATDEDGEGLVWTGDAQSAEMQTVISPAPHTTASDIPHDDPAVTEPIRTTPDAERRQLTVMFCDLADSTKLSQQLDPEDLREIIRAYQATAAEVIQPYEGHMAQYLGDGLLIYFGWPVAHEDDAQRALHAGLGIVEAITSKLNAHLENENGVQLTVRLGIHTGPVVVGEMGGDGRQENLATGETVNIAARLEGLAAPNTVVISRATARLVEGAFDLEELGTRMLKGVTEPMQVFRVLKPTAGHRHAEESLPDGGVFLVGRDEEVGILLRRWEQAKEGLGQVVLISGEAGIGKSSLVTAVRTHAADEGCTRMTFRCSPYHTNSALYPVITHLEYILRFAPDNSPDNKLDRLEQALRTTRLPLEESVPLLAMLLSIPLNERYPAPTVSPQQQRQQILDTLVGWLLAEAGRQPVLAVWEDLHLADPSTLEMLGLILDQTPTVPMLSMLTFRPDFEVPWATRSHLTPITLNRLQRPQVEALIRHLAAGKALPEEVVEHIVAKTDGVPLYVEELTKMLLESDLLMEETDQYVLTGPLLSMAIPDTLQDSLMARLDQMQAAKDVAQLGAVLGREFSYEMLQAIAAQDEATLQAGLAQLVEAELLYQRGRPPRATYIFKHALVQDAAYVSLLRRTRQQVHQQIAQLLETRYPETIQTQAELLAHHYTEAGLTELAVGYWQQAGQHAMRRFTYAEALAHLSRGLQELTSLSPTPAHTQQELDIQVNLGMALMAIKGPTSQETERAYRRAYELCQQVGETPQLYPVLVGLWRCVIFRLELDTARDIGEQLLSLAQPTQEPLLLMEAHYLIGFPLFWQGQTLTACAHAEQSATLYHTHAHHSRDVSYSLLTPGLSGALLVPLTRWMLGYPEQGLQSIDQLLTLSEASIDPYFQAIALDVIALFYSFCRDARTTQRYAEAAGAVAAQHGFPIWRVVADALHGWALCAQGQTETGMAQIRQTLAFYHDADVQLFRTYFPALLAEACWAQGQPEAGLTSLSEAFELVDRTGARWYEAELYRLKGELLLSAECGMRSAEWTPAACFQQALDISQAQQTKSLELRAATSLAHLWQSQGKGQDAYELLAPVYGWFAEGFDTADLQNAKTLLHELEE